MKSAPPKTIMGPEVALIVKLAVLLVMTLAGRAYCEVPDYGNSRETAYPIDVNGAFLDGEISPAADEDWFSFAAKEAGLYRIKLQNPSALAYHRLIVYTLDDLGELQEVTSCYANPGETQTRDVFVSSAGPCWLKVSYFAGALGTYRVSVTELGAFPTDKYPDSCVNPALLTVDAPPLDDAIGDGGLDEDWFRFPTDPLHKYQIVFTRATNCDAVFDLYDAYCGDRLLADNSTNRTLVSWYGDDYDLAVRSAGAATEGYFSIAVKDLGEYGDDHRNTYDEATPIDANGAWVVGVIQYAADYGSDEDLLSFTAKEAGLYRIKFHNQSGDYKNLIVYALDELGDAQVVTSYLTVQAGQTQTKDVFISSAGPCWLKALGYSSSVGLGTFRVSVTELGAFPTDKYPDSCVNPAVLTVDAPALDDAIGDFGLDEDWFRFQTGTLHKYQVTFTRASNCDAVFDLYDAYCQDRLLADISTNGTFVSWYGDKYDLAARSMYAAIEGYYTVALKDLGEWGDDHGNTYDDATPVDVNGAWLVGIIQYEADYGSDEDWFTFTAQEDGQYQVRFHNQSGGSKNLIVYVLDGTNSLRPVAYFSCVSVGQTQTRDISVSSGERYRLKADGCSGGMGTYRVSVLPLQPWPPRCGDAQHPYPPGDANSDCIVNFSDFAILADNWLVDNRP